MGFMDFLKNNLGHVLPVLLCAVFAIAIIADRIRALYFIYPLKNAKAFFDKINELVLAGKTGDAVALCDQYIKKPVARVVKTALLRAHLPEEAVEQGLALTVAEESRVIAKRTSFLATIANVATLLGLFGTIAGLIASFEAVANADPQQKSAMLSAGIGAAMNATMLGLGVAIPCMVVFAVLMSKQNAITAEVEDSASKTIDLLKMRHYASDPEEILEEHAEKAA